MKDNELLAEDKEKSPSGARAILRVPEVLHALALNRRGISLTDLSNELGVPKASLLRMLRTLQQADYVEHDGKYCLGPATYRLAGLVIQAANARPLPSCARPTMERLSQDTREGVILGVLSDDRTEIVYIDMIEALAPLRFTVPLGNSRPLFSSASGKALLTFLPEADRQSYIETADFSPLTKNTTRRDELPDILAEIKKSGIADVYNLSGGLSAWQEANLPVSRKKS